MSFKFYCKVEKFLALREKYKFDKFDRSEEGYSPCILYPTDPDVPYWEICLYPHKPAVVNLYSEDPRKLTYDRAVELSKRGRRRSHLPSYYHTTAKDFKADRYIMNAIRVESGSLDTLMCGDILNPEFRKFIVFNLDIFQGEF